jgi:hypothetical protein
MAFPFMPPVVPHRITRHEQSHQGGKAHLPGTQEEMKMIGHETPGKQLDVPLRNKVREALNKRFPIFRIPKDVPALDAPGHHMLQNLGYIQSRLSGHDESLDLSGRLVKNNYQK